MMITVADKKKKKEESIEDQIFKSELPVFVDFTAPWCGPCKALAPIIEELAEEYAGKLKVVKVNIDDNQELAQKFKVSSIPTLVLVGTDQKVTPVGVGLRSKTDLKIIIDDYLAKA